MKRHDLIIVIATVVFVLLCVIFVILSISRRNEVAKQAETGPQIAGEKLIEDATNKFKKLFEMDLPDGVKVNRYYYDSNDNFTLIDLVFEKEKYDSVFQTFQEKVVDREKGIMIFQKKLIYDNPDVYDFDDLPGLRRTPNELNAVCDDQVEIVDYIVGYYVDYIVIDGKDGRPQGFYDWIFAIDNKGLYHIMIKNWD